MGKASGGLLILAGLAVGAYALWPQHRTGTEVAAAQNVKRPPSPRTTADGATATPAAQAGAATRPMPAAKHSAPRSAADGPGLSSAKEPAVPSAPPPAIALRIDEAPPRVPLGSATAAPPLDREALTREIQGHLKRIGCYQDAVDGIWGPASRRAMRALTARANASLPVDQPEPVLLAMVESHKPGACGACPSGQAHTADGRCVPAALIAHAKEAHAKEADTREANTKETHVNAQTRAPAETNAKPAARERRAASEAARTSRTSRAKAPRRGVVRTYRPPVRGRMGLAGPQAAHRPVTGAAPAQRKRVIRYRSQRRARVRAPYARARQRRPVQAWSYPRRRQPPAWYSPFSLP